MHIKMGEIPNNKNEMIYFGNSDIRFCAVASNKIKH